MANCCRQPLLGPVVSLRSVLEALAVRDFDRIEKLLHPHIRFRGLLPGAVREGATAEEALPWLRRWFGDREVFNLTQCSIDQVIDWLHLAYRAQVYCQEGRQEVTHLLGVNVVKQASA